jgi:hypothetical protein
MFDRAIIEAPLQNRLMKRPVDASSVLLPISRKALGKGCGAKSNAR